MSNKYKMIEETIVVGGHVLHRIQALKTFGCFVHEGDLGGFIETEENLPQEGNCWVDCE